MLDDLTTRDQRMMFGLVTLVHMADNQQQLDSDTETLQSVGRKHLCQLSTLRWQQKGRPRHRAALRFAPHPSLRTFDHREHRRADPVPCAGNFAAGWYLLRSECLSKNMIVADRTKLLNGNSFRLGVSGSGKSMSAKEELVQIALATEDDFLILDPESEFGHLTRALGGEVIQISGHFGQPHQRAGYGLQLWG